jgi:glutamate--cysteine ligase
VQIAREGLRSRCRHDPFGRDESCYIEPLIEMTEGAPSQAERWLAKYHGEWRGDATRIFDEARV